MKRGGSPKLNLEPCTTAVSSPQSNGMAERFVKTMKEDYIAFMPKPDVRTALRNLAAAFTHYNENHPHSALGYLSEGIPAAGIVNLRYKNCPEMAGQDHLPGRTTSSGICVILTKRIPYDPGCNAAC
jgi:hypothetical protein